MTIIMSFRQWKYYLESVSEIEIWLNHANFKQFMSQIILNDCQACWFIQLMSYNFIIQYYQDILNSADESSWKSDYMQTKQSERCHRSSSMLISSEKYCEMSFKQFQLMSTQSNSSSLTSVKNKLAWQIDNLMSTLVNKFTIIVLEADRQYSCNVREIDLKTDNLIQVLSLQAMTQSKIKLTADNLVSYKKILTSLS